jgi:beta-lactamase class A
MRTAFLIFVLLVWPVAAAQAHPKVPDSAATAGPHAKIELERIDAMFKRGHVDARWFTSAVLAKASVKRINRTIAGLVKVLGAYKSVEETDQAFIARFENGSNAVVMRLNADGKIQTFGFGSTTVGSGSFDDALQTLRPEGGQLSYVITQGKTDVAEHDSATPLAVASAFKLAVLATLRNEIGAGRRGWSDVVPLAAQWKTLPSGIMQTWPDNTPVTLETYATNMMSVSDNTAAGALIHIIGPQALAAYALRNEPFLTVREMVTLKSTGAGAQRSAYLAATTPAARSLVLQKIDAMPVPSPNALLDTPVLAIEWQYSVRELCDLMGRVADLPLMSINSGVADRAEFRTIAYKGGWDFGAINLTTQVTTKNGATLCFSATLNNSAKDVDEDAFELAYSSVLHALRGR